MAKKSVKISHFDLNEHRPVFVISEAGVNHNGRLDLALELVEMAKRIGADAVKFQTFTAEQVCIESADMADYQVKNLGQRTTQREMIRALQLPESFYPPLMKRCEELGIVFFSTPHGGKSSVKLLGQLDLPVFKVGSGDLDNFPLFNELAKTGKPIIISTGMSSMSEIKAAVKYLTDKGVTRLIIMHCTTNYPCPPQDVNMAAMTTMMQELAFPIGYSDHTANSLAAELATLLGQAAYEFHITLDKTLPGPDQVASADEPEAKARIQAIRKLEKLDRTEKQTLLTKRAKEFSVVMGKKDKSPTESEKQFFQMRRSLVFARDLPQGHKVVEADLEAKRPGGAISPLHWEEFIGRKLKQSVKLDQQLQLDLFV